MDYHSKYLGAEVDALLDKIKDDNVGSIDSSLSTTSENPVKNKVITQELNKKVDKVEGKQLSTEDFTSELKGKLDGLSNYDDTKLKGDLGVLKGKVDEKQDYIADLDSIRSGASKGSTALQEHQDISYLATKDELSSGLSGKQDTISDLDSIRSGASKGSTALQEHQDISHLLPKIDFTTYETKTDSQIKELSDRVDELDRGEVFIMDNTLVFRNYADAKIEGETLKF